MKKKGFYLFLLFMLVIMAPQANATPPTRDYYNSWAWFSPISIAGQRLGLW